ncbi:MAG: 4-phosphoerythronate dehydrogenase [Gammaproteobacteria bacterium]
MKIVADDQILFAREAFSTIGDVLLVAGHEISPAQVANADVLLVRSVTTVDSELLAESSVQFVGSAASGVEHIDISHLEDRGIGFASAVGGNANAVAEYVLSAIFALLEKQTTTLSGQTAAIIGCGRIGRRVLDKLNTMGVDCVINDPPLKTKTGDRRYLTMDVVLSADIITVHVPLTRNGAYPTYHLVDEEFLARIKPNAILINTARGAVVDDEALKVALRKKDKPAVVLDVWNHEPKINADLLKNIEIGTPHIAGYSFDGKLRATEIIYTSMCEFFNIRPLWNSNRYLSKHAANDFKISCSFTDDEIIQMAVLATYDVRGDAASLKQMLRLPHYQRGHYFEDLRTEYPLRREFHSTLICLPSNKRRVARKLRRLGFRIDIQEPAVMMGSDRNGYG